MNPPLFYWHSGGVVMSAGARAMCWADVMALLALHRDEVRAAEAAGCIAAAAKSRRLAAQLVAARRAAARWRRASRPSMGGARSGRKMIFP